MELPALSILADYLVLFYILIRASRRKNGEENLYRAPYKTSFLLMGRVLIAYHDVTGYRIQR